MTQEFNAIYSDGVLRPDSPLDLPEGTYVFLRIENKLSSGGDLDQISRQRESLAAMFAQVDALPQVPRQDDWSGRDHDKILYGADS